VTGRTRATAGKDIVDYKGMQKEPAVSNLRVSKRLLDN